jgi:hypothetical protein
VLGRFRPALPDLENSDGFESCQKGVKNGIKALNFWRISGGFYQLFLADSGGFLHQIWRI